MFKRPQLSLTDYNNHQLKDFEKRPLEYKAIDHLGCIDCPQFEPKEESEGIIYDGFCIGKPLPFCQKELQGILKGS